MSVIQVEEGRAGLRGATELVAPPVVEARYLEPLIFEGHYRDKYRHFIRKALYFAWREGPITTWRKYRSKRLERKIEGELKVVVAEIEVRGERYIGFTRALGQRLIFDRRLIFSTTGSLPALEGIELSPESRTDLESYLPVPSAPLPTHLPGTLLSENPELRPTDREIFEPYYLDPGSWGDRVVPPSSPRAASVVGGVYLLGFGGYVRENVLRHFRGHRVHALDYRAELIREFDPEVGRGVDIVTDSFDSILDSLALDPNPLVIISSYHSDHAPMALRVLERNPGARLFVEKPPIVELSDLGPLLEARRGGAWIDIGFNRRHAPLTQRLRAEVGALPRPLLFTALVKELKIPPTHWYHWPNQGSRVTGNLCHWIDLAYHLIEERPVELNLVRSGDTVNLGILFVDGSLASIIATDLGDDLTGVTERIEVRGGDTTLVIDDFHRLEVLRPQGTERVRRIRREKGHAAMYAELRRRWAHGEGPSYPIEDLYWTPYLTALATELYQTGGGTARVGAEVPGRVMEGV